MTDSFDLVVEPNAENTGIDLRLTRTDGGEAIFRSVDFRPLPLSKKQALFDLRSYLRLYVERGHEEESVARTGVFLAEDILGREIFLKLWEPQSQRSLRVLLPRAQEKGNWLGAAATRIPWEIARPSPKYQTLGERNLLIRVVHDMEEPATKPIDLGKDGSLRVLFVFAEARHSQPLSARRERREIEQLFESEIFPDRKIVVDFLTHGVTSERLREQIKNRSGYHVVHWSGHGHQNLLQLAGVRGTTDQLSGEELVDLFSKAGGFLPQFVFLSACQSGDVQQVKNWQSFLSATRGEEPGTRGVAPWDDHPGRDIDIEVRPGYTGIAHALIQGGVPSVVAMRYAVGDEYARNLATELYRALFAHIGPKTVSAALSLARKELLGRNRPDASRFDAADHATPVLYGAEDPGFFWLPERSPSLDTREPRLHRIAELTIREHPSFVGRSWQLADLGSTFIGAARSREVRPVAVVTGLGGMGKTALAAEALDLWEQRFEWVLLYQAKPNALGFEATLRDIHLKLSSELGRYHEKVKKRPADAIYREANADFNGPERMARLSRNLVEALRDEPILLVLDNFESNLKPPAESGDSVNEPLWNCQDPDWDACLTLLAHELVGSPSRILITCRHQLAALAGDAATHSLRVRLGPLPAGEASLFLREHAGLSRMLFGRNDAEKDLARRLLKASRFHPLLMDRLARLATGGAELREQLHAALDAIETNLNVTTLPELFAIERGDETDATELAYLEDALATSIDELIRGASPEARRLLWMIAVANEPVSLELVKQAWGGPAIAPLVAQLCAVGLAVEAHKGPDDDNPDLTCHELVRERIRTWMNERPENRGDLTENAFRLAYAELLEAEFEAFQQKDMKRALEAGHRALVYDVQAEAWERLRGFASQLVTSASDPAMLQEVIPHLKAAVEAAPEGGPKQSCLIYLADALDGSGQHEASLFFFDQAADHVRTVTGRTDAAGQQNWVDFAAMSGNWAFALRSVGNLAESRRRQLESANARRRADGSLVHVLGSELEALRIDILEGNAAKTLPQVETRLAQVEGMWKEPGASDPELLARVLIVALDVAADAHFALQDWEAALRRVDKILEVKQALGFPPEDIAKDRMNRANVLGCLGQFVEAKSEMEASLEILGNDPCHTAASLSSLASLFGKQNDLLQAIVLERRALATREQLPDPGDRAISHHNLAQYLEKDGSPSALVESPLHQLAALIYFHVAALGQGVQASLSNYSVRFLRARRRGMTLTVPRVSELLTEKAFRPLGEWLHGRRLNDVQLQARLDQLLESAREVSGRVTAP